jgi:hypothetical protein
MDKTEGFFLVMFFFIVGVSAFLYFQQDDFQLTCIVSDIDGNKYCVREREKVKDAVNLLGKVVSKMEKFIQILNEKFPEDVRVQRLVKNFNPKKVNETLPTSTYTAYSENKGEKTAFCLNKKSKTDNSHLIDEHTLTFVAIHELSHDMSSQIGHKSEFWDNFYFLLEEAKIAKIHEPKNYKESPAEYCGMTIHDNPYYDLHSN